MCGGPRDFTGSAFSKTWLLLELRQVLSWESPAVFLHTPLEEKRPWGPFYQLRQVLAKGRHLLQILLKALYRPQQINSYPVLIVWLFANCTVSKKPSIEVKLTSNRSSANPYPRCFTWSTRTKSVNSS